MVFRVKNCRFYFKVINKNMSYRLVIVMGVGLRREWVRDEGGRI